MDKPTPRPVQWDTGFWIYAEQGVLSAQRCRECGRLQHYPKPVCCECLSCALDFVPLSGEGTIYSFTTVRQPANPAFAAEAPYTLLDVALREGIRIVSRLADEADSVGLAIGNEVIAVFKPVGDGTLRLPFFRSRNV